MTIVLIVGLALCVLSTVLALVFWRSGGKGLVLGGIASVVTGAALLVNSDTATYLLVALGVILTVVSLRNVDGSVWRNTRVVLWLLGLAVLAIVTSALADVSPNIQTVLLWAVGLLSGGLIAVIIMKTVRLLWSGTHRRNPKLRNS